MTKKAGILSLSLTVAAVAAYFAVNYLRFGNGVKWWLFGFHLTLTAAGLLVGLAAILMRQWWGLVSIGACAYFFKIQFLS